LIDRTFLGKSLSDLEFNDLNITLQPISEHL